MIQAAGTKRVDLEHHLSSTALLRAPLAPTTANQRSFLCLAGLAALMLTLTGCQTPPGSTAAEEGLREPTPASTESARAPAPRPPKFETNGLRENSLGMFFKPVAGTKVYFSVWETRVQDYAAYAAANSGVDGKWKDPIWEAKPVTPGPKNPVVNVSWPDAKAFCRWLTEKERKDGKLGADEEYRLPTDAEWSWAVGIGRREGTGTPGEKDGKLKNIYPWGKQWPPPQSAGNYDDYSIYRIFGYQDGFARTSPVGSYPPNAQGLCDLGGNAWEWCEDWYDNTGTYRVLRGGSWINHVQDFLLSSYRNHVAPGTRYDCYGFRVVLVTAGFAR